LPPEGYFFSEEKKQNSLFFCTGALGAELARIRKSSALIFTRPMLKQS
jgi:hypothetical protein